MNGTHVTPRVGGTAEDGARDWDWDRDGTHVTPEVGGTADSDGAQDRDWD